MNDLAGQTVRGYELHDLIGAGGFGAVYRAYQPLIKRDVAMKIILPEYANHPDFIRRFEFEAQLVARLEHIHIVPLYDYWREPNGAYLVMRWLRGGSLRGRLKSSGTVDSETAAQIVNQISSALAVAHRRGVVHRDIKPDNILFDDEGNAFLADFGIAKDLRETTVTRDDINDGALTGSPFYLAPEQAQNQPVTPQTDIYSLGIVIYEMLTGHPPFMSDKGLMAVLLAHINEAVPSVLPQRPDLTVGVDRVIQRATAKDPGSRYGTVNELALEFTHALVGATAKAAPSSVISPESIDAAELDDLLVVTKPLSASTLIIVPGIEIANPYKGLQAFQEADAGEFFGRKALIERLIERMQEPGDISRFLAVIGPSGSGKSSVVKAGLVPALRKGALPGSDRWYYVEMVPGTDPFQELASALLGIASQPPENLLERLKADERGLVEIAQQVIQPGSELLLVVDQFEEVFTQLDDEAERAHFLQLLLMAIAEPASRIRLIITLRADFYDRPLLYPGFGDMVRRRNEVVLPLTPDEMREAIVGPAHKVGLTVETGLVAAIVAEVAEQPGALPLMQYALTELFERRQDTTLTLEAYHASGGVLGALARRAEEMYQAASGDEQAALRQIFLRLVNVGDGMENTRRRATQVELMSLVEDDTIVSSLLDRLGKYRLLTFDHDPQTRIPTIEVAHEALIREWARLRGWLDDSREALLLQRKLIAASAEWNANNRDRSFLASGLQLQRYEGLLSQESDLALTPAEIEYIRASITERERVEAEKLAQQRRMQRLRQALLWGALAALAIVSIFAVYALIQRSEARDQRDRAERSAEISDSLALVANAQTELVTYNTDLAIALAIKANELDDPPAEARRMLERAIFTPGTRRIVTVHENVVFTAAYSPDGTQAISGDLDGKIILWDVATGQKVREYGPDDGDTDAVEGHTRLVRSVAFSPDGKTFLSGAADSRMILWDVETGEPLRVFGPDDPDTEAVEGHARAVRTVLYAGDGRAVSASDDWTLALWDLNTGEMIRQFEGHQERVRGAAISPDGTMIASAAYDNLVKLWDIETGAEIKSFEGHDNQATAVAFSPDGTMLLSGSADRTLRLWDIESGTEIRQMQGHSTWVKSVAFRSDGRVALSSSDDATVRLWNVQTGDQIARYDGHGDFVEQAVFSPDETHILSASGDMTLRIWDIANGAEIRRYNGHSDGVLEADLSPDGTLLATGSYDNTIRLWDVETGEQRLVFEEHTAYPSVLQISPDGRLVASSDASGGWVDELDAENPVNVVLIWDAATGEVIHRLAGHKDSVNSAAWSPDGSQFITGSKDTAIIVWDLETDSPAQIIGEQKNDYQWVNALEYSPDGTIVAAGLDAGDPVVVLYDAATWEVLRRLEGHGEGSSIESVEFSADGKLLLSGSSDQTARVWDVQTGAVVHVLEGHLSTVARARFNADATRIVTASYDGTLRLWDASTGQMIRELINGPAVWSMVYHPDGARVVTGSEDSTVRMWNAQPLTLDDLLAWVHENRAVIELTCGQREQYRVEPRCDAQGVYPTSTPYSG